MVGCQVQGALKMSTLEAASRAPCQEGVVCPEHTCLPCDVSSKHRPNSQMERVAEAGNLFTRTSLIATWPSMGKDSL